MCSEYSNVYHISILGETYVDFENGLVYVHGTKICNNLQDFSKLKATIKVFAGYLNYKHNRERNINFLCDITTQKKKYINSRSILCNTLIMLDFKIVQKSNMSFLRIFISGREYYISKEQLDVFLVQLSEFDKNKYIFSKYEDDYNFNISQIIGELVIKDDNPTRCYHA